MNRKLLVFVQRALIRIYDCELLTDHPNIHKNADTTPDICHQPFLTPQLSCKQDKYTFTIQIVLLNCLYSILLSLKCLSYHESVSKINCIENRI